MKKEPISTRGPLWRLHKRIDVLSAALEKIKGPTPCSGAMTTDEDGNLLSSDKRKTMRALHAEACVRCIARKALDDVADLERK